MEQIYNSEVEDDDVPTQRDLCHKWNRTECEILDFFFFLS